MEFRILGPLEIHAGGEAVPLGGLKPRALLAMLLLYPNETVSAERLAMGLWGEEAGGDAVRTLHVHVSRLRKALGEPAVLETTTGGYRLRVRPGELDLDGFEGLVAAGRAKLDGGDAAGAANLLREALELWRGPPLAGVAAAPFAADAIARLDEQRLAALETRLEADLAAGRHAELVGELQQLAATHPLRERLHALLMLALYRGGRQADALEVYARARIHLAEGLGLEPGPALRTLQAEILEQAASLDPGETSGVAPPVVALPPRPTGLLGREAAVRSIAGMLRRDGPQLVTVIGVGGVGKTSLAIEVAHRVAGRLADGAVFVDLAALSDPSHAADAILQALGGTPEPGVTVSERLRQLVAPREQLVVLDNFEHILAAAPLVAELLGAGARLKILATSRTALDLHHEQRYLVDPLDQPGTDAPGAVTAAPATALFIARATARDPAFRLTDSGAAAIAAICSRVDALPLAIELAAALTSVLSPEEIAGRLERAVSGLGAGPRDAPARQRTLRATLDWSHALLTDDEAATFARLSVFAGGCRPDAAEQVAGAPLEVIERLVAQSMLVRRPGGDGSTRLVMLEPIRDYAAGRLAAHPDAAAVEQAHRRYFVELAAIAEDHLMGPDQVAWGLRIDAEAANVRRALDGARAAGDVEAVLRIFGGLADWYFDRGLWSEAQGWLEWALERSDERVSPELRATGWHVLAYLLWPEEDLERSLATLDRSWELYRETDDAFGMAHSQILRGYTHLRRGEPDAARHAGEAALQLAQGLGGTPLGLALALLAETELDPANAGATAAQAAEHLERAGDLRSLARMWEDLGYNALVAGDIDEARALIGRWLALRDELGELGESVTALAIRGVITAESGDLGDAKLQFREALVRYRARGVKPGLPWVLLGLAVVAAREGASTDAARLVGAATAARATRPGPDALERRLEATVHSTAGRRCEAEAWERAVAAGQRLDPRERIELGLELTGSAGPPPPSARRAWPRPPARPGPRVTRRRPDRGFVAGVTAGRDRHDEPSSRSVVAAHDGTSTTTIAIGIAGCLLLIGGTIAFAGRGRLRTRRTRIAA